MAIGSGGVSRSVPAVVGLRDQLDMIRNAEVYQQRLDELDQRETKALEAEAWAAGITNAAKAEATEIVAAAKVEAREIKQTASAAVAGWQAEHDAERKKLTADKAQATRLWNERNIELADREKAVANRERLAQEAAAEAERVAENARRIEAEANTMKQAMIAAIAGVPA